MKSRKEKKVLIGGKNDGLDQGKSERNSKRQKGGKKRDTCADYDRSDQILFTKKPRKLIKALEF